MKFQSALAYLLLVWKIILKKGKRLEDFFLSKFTNSMIKILEVLFQIEKQKK